MFKTMYIITFLSVVLFNSKTSFGQGLKKELGICGKSASLILKLEAEKDPVITEAFLRDDEFCDNGRYEENANFILSFYNAQDKIVYDKHIFLNPLTFHEGFDPKAPTKFKNTKIIEGNSRIIKIPVSKEMGEVASYKIQSLEGKNKKAYDKKKIKW